MERGTAICGTCRHWETGTSFETTKANFCAMEDGWLTEYHDIGRIQAFTIEVAGSHPA